MNNFVNLNKRAKETIIEVKNKICYRKPLIIGTMQLIELSPFINFNTIKS